MAALDATPDELRRENLYLRDRVAQLTGDVSDLSAENGRLRQERERLHGRQPTHGPNPLVGGQ
jgi:hypothetical protein